MFCTIYILTAACDVICMGMVGTDVSFESFHFVIMLGTIAFVIGLILTLTTPSSTKRQGYSSYNTSNQDYSYTHGMNKNSMAGNEWRCPKCLTVNPKYVTTCTCGCTLEAYYRDLKRKQEVEKQKNEEKNVVLKENYEEFNKEIIEYLEKHGNKDITSKEGMILRILYKSEEPRSLAEIIKGVPRSCSITDLKDSLSDLEKKGLIKLYENNKYSLIEGDILPPIKTEPIQETSSVPIVSASEENATTVNDKYDEIRKLKSLYDDSIITQEEFEQKKKQLLGL